MQVRKAVEGDAQSAYMVFVDAVRGTLEVQQSAEVEALWLGMLTAGELERRFRDLDCWVAEVEGDIVGFSVLVAEACELRSLYVDPHHQGLGIGQALLRACEDRARELGLVELWLNGSPDAVSFYLSQEWVDGGEEACRLGLHGGRKMVRKL